MRRILPRPGQESVWDFPRPPRLEPTRALVTVRFGGRDIATTQSALRVLETSHPPVYYVPPADIESGVLVADRGGSFCEFKGEARYWSIRVGRQVAARSAWYYPHPAPGYEAMADHVAFYPSRVEACFVDGERVRAQEGDFYGGWITDAVVGPFKGGPGTLGW